VISRILKLFAAAALALGLATIARESVLRSLEQVEEALDFELTDLARGMNVVLIVLDTTPGKSLDLLNPQSTPLLSRRASEAVVFTKAYAAAPWTRPAIASILTGYHPKVHGVREFTSWYNRGIVTLGQMLRLHGYSTFRQGFDHYTQINADTNPFATLSSPAVADAAINFIKTEKSAARSNNFFLFAHFFDPHFDYIHHPEFNRTSWYNGALTPKTSFFDIDRDYPSYSGADFSFLRDLHLEEVSFTERHVERIFKALLLSPYADNTVVILIADHGEEFHEHGHLWHGHSMYDEVIRVPLMVWAPKKLKPRVVERWVSAMDVVPSLVNVKHLVSEEKFFGRSLFEEPPAQERWLFSEVGDNTGHPFRSIDAVLREPLKLIVNHAEGTTGLFDLRADPEENNNLISNESLAAPFKAQLEESTKELSRFIELQPDLSKPLSAAQVKELRSVGYLSGTAKLEPKPGP
jgi:arylsulfatase A-like enzyme